MAGIKRTGKTTRTSSTKRVGSSRASTSRSVSRPTKTTTQRSQFVKQGTSANTTTPKAPVKKSIQRTPVQKTQPKAAPTQTPQSDPWAKLQDISTKKEVPKTQQIVNDVINKAKTAPKDNGMELPIRKGNPIKTEPGEMELPIRKGPLTEIPKGNMVMDAGTKPAADAGTKPAADAGTGGGGLFGNALNAFGLGGQEKPAAAGDQANKPAEAEKKEGGSLFGNLLGGAKDAVVNTALDGMGLGDFKDIGLADRLTKLSPEQRGNLMDLASTLKEQEKQAGGKAIDLKQHLGKLSTEEKGKLFDLAASGKLKELMSDLPRLQKAAEASKPNQQELQALQQISQMLGRDKLGGADGKFNYGDMNAIANGLMRDRGGLRQQVLNQLNSEGKRFQARVANRALNGQRGLFTRRALQQINQQVPSEIKGQISQGLREAQVDPQTARTFDNTPRNLSFNEMKQFEQNMQALKGMQKRLGDALGQQVVFPQGVSQEAINHTIQGALDPQADARNIDRVLQSIIHNGRVELPLPPGGVLVPNR